MLTRVAFREGNLGTAKGTPSEGCNEMVLQYKQKSKAPLQQQRDQCRPKTSLK
jgi:hypothetical protein